MNDGKDILCDIKNILSDNGQYPVKLKAGTDYDSMQDVTNRIG